MEGSAAGEDAADAESSNWKQALHRHLSAPAFPVSPSLLQRSARRTHNLSSGEDTFSALNVTPLDQVRVVIVGQDPYHGPGRGSRALLFRFTRASGSTVTQNIYRGTH
jgi:uracil-DNA glycosylase